MIFKKRIKPIKLQTPQQLDELTASGKPVFLDFWQTDCQPCRTMDGIVSELAHEYRDSAHVVKVDVRSAPDLAQRYRVMSTPTFVVIGVSKKKKSKKSRKPNGGPAERWRASGLVKKDLLQQALERNGAERA